MNYLAQGSVNRKSSNNRQRGRQRRLRHKSLLWRNRNQHRHLHRDSISWRQWNFLRLARSPYVRTHRPDASAKRIAVDEWICIRTRLSSCISRTPWVRMWKEENRWVLHRWTLSCLTYQPKWSKRSEDHPSWQEPNLSADQSITEWNESTNTWWWRHSA